MLQARKWMTYGFVPWTIMFGEQETEASSPQGTTPQLQNQPRTEPEVPAPVSTQAAPAPLVQVKFRRALIEVDDPAEFWSGVVGGQVAALEEEGPLTGGQVFALFEDAVRDVEFSETWLAGYLLALGDALLRQRKLYPRSYVARLQFLQAQKRKHQED